VLATCTGDTGLDGLARVLEGFGLGDGVLWVGSGEVTVVGDVQRAEEEERGSWALSSSSPPFLTARVGVEGAGLDRGDSPGMATGTRRTGAVIFTVKPIFSDFCSLGVRSNARKKLKFEFLKFFTLGGQQMRQGCQRYFCYTERLSFAEILIRILDMVTISDSKFG
jgi:hypothetical protein